MAWRASKLWILFDADFAVGVNERTYRAPGSEPTPRRRLARIRRITLEDGLFLHGPGIGYGTRSRRHQHGRIGMARRGIDFRSRPFLDDPAQIHHGNAVREVTNDSKVVRDEQNGQIEPVTQIGENVDHLCLDRHVKGRDRLVADQNPRFDGQGAGNTDALTLATRKGLRVTVEIGRIEPDKIQ